MTSLKKLRKAIEKIDKFFKKMDAEIEELEKGNFELNLKLVKKKVVERVDIEDVSRDELKDVIKEVVSEVMETYAFKYVLADEGIDLVKYRVLS